MVQYSFDQVVRGIEHFASQWVCESFQLNADEPLHCHLKTFTDEDYCPLMFLRDLAEYFGFELSEQRAAGWLKLKKKASTDRCGRTVTSRIEETPRTGRDLVKLIVNRSECPDFSPRNLLGNRCAAAGCFLGISSLVRSKPRFAPSTSIRQVLSTWEYEDLLARLAWMLDISTQDLDVVKVKKSRIDSVARFAAWSILVAAMLLSVFLMNGWDTSVRVIATPVMGFCGLVACTYLAEWLKRRLDLEFAPGVRSFRDLTNQLLSVI